MKNWLDHIRKPDDTTKLSKKITITIFLFILGIVLGCFAKWLDNLSINDSIWWQHLLGILDLRNIFSEIAIWLFLALAISIYSKTPVWASIRVFFFFLGMCISYHIYTIVFSGFNPKHYMMIWYTLTIISPFLAFLCWYGKGKTGPSILLNILILAIMIQSCFSIGFWYFDLNNILNAILFLATLFLLYQTPKHTLYSFLGALLLAYSFSFIMR